MKRLALRRETLTELASGELTLVNGAALPSVFCLSAVTYCDVACTAVGRVETVLTEAVRFPTDRCTPPPQ